VTSFLSGKKHHIPVSAKILYIKLRFKHTINICENLRNLREKHSPEISPYQTTKKPLLLQRLSKSDPDWIRTNDPQLRRLLLYPTELPNLCFKLRSVKIALICIQPKHNYGCEDK
jgi:hypothetical protein